MKIFVTTLLIFFCQTSLAQTAGRLLDAFGNSCPLTRGTANPLNDARNAITTSSNLLSNIQIDRDHGGNCASAVAAAQSSMNQITLQNTSPGNGTQGNVGGGGGGGGDGKGGSAPGVNPPAGGNSIPSGNNGNGTVPNPTTDSAYQRAFASLEAQDHLNDLESQIAALRREYSDPNTTEMRKSMIENEIARIQGEINSIHMDERASATRSRLTVYQHVNTAADRLLGAIQNCQSAPDIIAQLTPVALNIGSSLGAIGGATALALDAVANIVGSIVSYFRNRDVRNTQEALGRASTPTAVRCAYLTMGQQFCHADEQRSNFLTSRGQFPADGDQIQSRLLRYDREGQCSLSGLSLMGENIRNEGGLSTAVFNITQRLRELGSPNFSETGIDRIIYGTGGARGLLDRVQRVDNYYEYVERMVNAERENQVALVTSAGADSEAGQRAAERARRLRNITRDVQARRIVTHQLRTDLETYRNNTQNNFNPNSSNTPHLEALRNSLNAYMGSESSTNILTTSLTSINDFHREALGIKWNRELAMLPLASQNASTLNLQRRQTLRNRLQALTTASQDESARLVAVNVAELSEVAARYQRETISHSVITQRDNFEIMGNFLAPHLEQSISDLSSRIQSSGSDSTVGAMRDQLVGLCESTLSLQRDHITNTMKNRCNDLIYRNEGNKNITFREMYDRIALRTTGWSTDIACHAFFHPDNVIRNQ